MSRERGIRAAATCLAAILVAAGLLAAPSTSVAAVGPCPWVGSAASPTVRAYQLLEQMTLEQKLQIMYPSAASTPLQLGYQQVTLPIPELCVPSVVFQGSAGGVRGTPAGTATQLPSPLSVGATFDRSAAAGFGTVQGEEARAKGIDGVQAPYVNIDRVPLSGRTAESYGEDPYLSSELATADVHALTDAGVFSITQSFSAYSQEQGRNEEGGPANVLISERALQEVYHAPLRAAVAAGADGLMCTYTEINGVWSCENPYLIQEIINEQWEFAGFVRTDFGASHDEIAAINAGTAYFNPFSAGVRAAVTTAVQDGTIPVSRLNNAVTRILRTMFTWGVFDRERGGTFDLDARTPAHVDTARDIAEKGIVLLKNDGVLPIDRSTVGSIAVIGDHAHTDAVTILSGSGAVQGTAEQVITALEGLQAAAGPDIAVSYYGGGSLADAAAAAASADVAVVVAAHPAGEFGDIDSLALPDNQDALIEAVAAANPNTVVVLNTGNAVLMPWLDDVAGVLEAWFTGEQTGTATAALLFGDANPSGKLPISFPTSDTNHPTGTAEQYPGAADGIHYSEGLNVGYRGYQANGIEPLFPFGFGLSYTTFAFSDLQVSAPEITSLDRVTVSATVANTGDRAGTEVAQLYLVAPQETGAPPVQLRGFQRVTLQPGDSARVEFELTADDLQFWDENAHTWSVAEGTYGVRLGNSSANLPLSGAFQVHGTLGSRALAVAAPDHVAPGSTFGVTATLQAGGTLAINAPDISLVVPEGWSATRVDGPQNSLTPDRSTTATWRVTVPDDATPDVPIVTAVAAVQASDGGSAHLRASAELMVSGDVAESPTPWDPASVYLEGATVTFGGSTWVATWWTRDQRPGDPYGPWQELIDSGDGTAVWTPSRIFESGDAVLYGGDRYVAKWWTRNQAPGDQYGPWQPAG